MENRHLHTQTHNSISILLFHSIYSLLDGLCFLLFRSFFFSEIFRRFYLFFYFNRFAARVRSRVSCSLAFPPHTTHEIQISFKKNVEHVFGWL